MTKRSSASRGEFFAIGKSQWDLACDLGIRAAAAFIIQGCGSDKNNRLTAWGAHAVESYGAMTWNHAKKSIACLRPASLSVPTGRKDAHGRPIYRIGRPDDARDLIWLPRSLVEGIAYEAPIIKRFRKLESVDPDFARDALHLFIALYRLHDLRNEAGIARDLISRKYRRERIADMGDYVYFGFSKIERDVSTDLYFQDFLGRESEFWRAIDLYEKWDALEEIAYLAESDNPDAPLIHALDGDESAHDVAHALRDLADDLPEEFHRQAEQYDFVIPVANQPENQNCAVVGVMRLAHRPLNQTTSEWQTSHIANCKRYAGEYRSIGKTNVRGLGVVAG